MVKEESKDSQKRFSFLLTKWNHLFSRRVDFSKREGCPLVALGCNLQI